MSSECNYRDNFFAASFLTTERPFLVGLWHMAVKIQSERFEIGFGVVISVLYLFARTKTQSHIVLAGIASEPERLDVIKAHVMTTG
jgi:hypothetical protein